MCIVSVFVINRFTLINLPLFLLITPNSSSHLTQNYTRIHRSTSYNYSYCLNEVSKTH